MGLFDMFKKKSDPAPAASAVLAPVAGRVVELAEVPDPVFSGGMMGKGCAIWPADGVMVAPLSGKVTVAMGHAVGIAAADGVEVLVHIGVDTVEMNGDGFEVLISQDQEVKAGQACIKFDREKIAAAGHPDCVILAVTNTDDFAAVDVAVAPESTVAAGDELLKVTK